MWTAKMVFTFFKSQILETRVPHLILLLDKVFKPSTLDVPEVYDASLLAPEAFVLYRFAASLVKVCNTCKLC